MEQYENIKTYTIPRLILDIGAIFIMFQLVVTINISIPLYYIWFVIMLYNGIVWHLIYLTLFHKLKDLRVQNIFNMIRDALVAIILTFIFVYGTGLSDWDYFWTITITFVALSIVNAAFLSWDRINPEIKSIEQESIKFEEESAEM